MSKKVVVLGATGSIGTQTLEVASALDLEVTALAAHRPSRALAEIAGRFPDALVIATGGTADGREAFSSSIDQTPLFGVEPVLDVASQSDCIVVNGIVGAAGLRASIATLEAENRLALANKESMVAGGPIVRRALASGGELIPVDSEHSALYQCLAGESGDTVARLVLTASGGPFRGRDHDSLVDVTPEEALAHPTWDMGPRITVDSATLFNKGLEVIEAHYLFDMAYDKIDVVVHPQSILHSAVEFVDGSWKGHFGYPDMRIPIQYALTAPDRTPTPVSQFRLAGLTLDFEEPDRETFRALDLAFDAGRRGGSAPATLNAADEVAVAGFLEGHIGFLEIAEIVERTLDECEWREVSTVDDVYDVDHESRSIATRLISSSRR